MNDLNTLPPPPSSQCEYLEEFPVQALAQLPSLSGHQVPRGGLLVLVMQYGLNRSDSLGPGRSESEWTQAWKSNFLHPVLYYYDTLPTGGCSGLEAQTHSRVFCFKGQYRSQWN